MILITHLLVINSLGDLGLPLNQVVQPEFLSANHLVVERVEETTRYPQNSQFYCWHLTNSSKDFLLQINVCVSNSKPGSFVLKKYISASGEPHTDHPYSGNSLGRGFDSENSNSGGSYEVIGDHERVYATFGPYQYMNSNGDYEIAKIEKVQYLATIEKTLRTVYSGTVAARTSLTSPIEIGGSRVPARVDLFGDTQFIELFRWAAVRAWKVSPMSPDSIVTLTKGDHTVTLYLGGHQCKVDGKEQEMGQPMINVEGTGIFVPYTLDAIVQKL